MLELKRALRNLLRSPLWTTGATFTIALGLGLSTAAFSIVYGTILLDLPFPGGDELYRVAWVNQHDGEAQPMRWQDFETLRNSSPDLVTDVAAWSGLAFALGLPGEALQAVNGALVSGNFFPLLGVRPEVGQWIDHGTSRQPVVVISHALWEQVFGRDPEAVGREVRISHQRALIVGVMPPGLRFPLNQDLWMPLEGFGESGLGRQIPLQLLARMRSGSIEAAEAELQGILGGVEPPSDTSRTHLMPFIEGYTREVRKALWFLWLGALGVLLIGCLNTGQLIASRVVNRSRALSIRKALGAGRFQRAWTILAEVIWLSVGAVALAIPVTLAGIRLYQHFGELVGSFWVDVGIHPPVLAFVAGAFLGTVLLSTWIPWLVAQRISATDLLQSRTASPGRLFSRLAHLSLGVQVCLTLAVLVATVLMGQSLRQFADRDLAREPERIVTGSFNLWASDRGRDYDPGERLALFRKIRDRVEAQPEFETVALGTTVPGGRSVPIEAELESGRKIQVRTATVSPGYFETLGHSILQGRDFDERDGPGGREVALVSRTLAHRYLDQEEILGRQIRRVRDDEVGPWVTVVGVVPDLFLDWDQLAERMGSRPQPALYRPLAQHPPQALNVLARTQTEPASGLRKLHDLLVSADPNAMVSAGLTVADHLQDAVGRQRTLAALFGALSGVALFLSCIGIGALVAFTVERRRPELGVRRALGAPGRALLILVLRHTGRALGIGLMAGLGLAWIIAGLLEHLLFGVGPHDVAPFAVATGVLATTALLATLLPAHRALQIDAMEVLREE